MCEFSGKEYRSSDPMRMLIQDNNLLLLVMGRFGISTGFGDKSVAACCHEREVDAETFLAVANFCSKRSCTPERVKLRPLIGYLKSAHEFFLEYNLPAIRRKLVEAINYAAGDEIALLIMRFYDEYAAEVRRHMEYEDTEVFTYVEALLQGNVLPDYSIATFSDKHLPVTEKLRELKDVIIRYYPQHNNFLLNGVLLDIMICEDDLTNHCEVENRLFVPAVERLERQLRNNPAPAPRSGTNTTELTDREKSVLALVAKGLSNKEIADRLFVSVHTVVKHRQHITNKLQIHTPSGLTIYAIVHGLIDLNDIRNE